MKTYSVVIVGLGQVGLHYDLSSTNNTTLTHSKAFNDHAFFDVVGAYDISSDNVDLYNRTYAPVATTSVSNCFSGLSKVDVLVISTPTSNRLDILTNILAYTKPSLVLIEKPYALCLSEMLLIESLARLHSFKVFINYPRLVNPAYLRLKSLISSSVVQTPTLAICAYSKGFLNSGTHFLTLSSFLLGKLSNPYLIKKSASALADDFDLDASVSVGSTTLYILSTRQTETFVNSLILHTPSSRIVIDQESHSISIVNASLSADYPGYNLLVGSSQEIKIDTLHAQTYVTQALYSELSDHRTTLLSGSEAISMHRILSSANLV